MSKYDLNNVVLQLYWNHISAWVFYYKFAAYFQNSFSLEQLWRAACENTILKLTMKNSWRIRSQVSSLSQKSKNVTPYI